MVLDDDASRPFSQRGLIDLVRDLSLSMSSAELLASRLKENPSFLTALATDINSTSFFYLKRVGLGVLYIDCTASTQAGGATV